jgi:hypothetical protein
MAVCSHGPPNRQHSVCAKISMLRYEGPARQSLLRIACLHLDKHLTTRKEDTISAMMMINSPPHQGVQTQCAT